MHAISDMTSCNMPQMECLLAGSIIIYEKKIKIHIVFSVLLLKSWLDFHRCLCDPRRVCLFRRGPAHVHAHNFPKQRLVIEPTVHAMAPLSRILHLQHRHQAREKKHLQFVPTLNWLYFFRS